jgi:hypothetical protein
MRIKQLLEEEKEDSFYVMNDYAQYYIGLKFGKANFGDDFSKARELTNNAQFKNLQYLSNDPIEKIYI